MAASSPQHPFESDPMYASLAKAARELATISDNVASEITQRQTWLQGLKLPLETWVTMRETEYDFETKMEDRDGDFLMEPRSDELELGWTREVKEWVLA